MSAVDVLAAWDRQIEWLRDLVATNPGSECHTEELQEAIEARDAVAELMEAAAHASVILRAKGGPTAGERDEAVARLNAAVSAAKGGA